MLLFKDKEVDSGNFDHMADVVVHNQYIAVPKGRRSQQDLIFEADDDEWQQMLWFCQFSGLDLLYVLDRPLDVRVRLSKGLGGSVSFKYASMVYVQVDEQIHAIKSRVGWKTHLTFRNQTADEREEVEHPDLQAESAAMRETLLLSLGPVCDKCGHDDYAVMDIYRPVGGRVERFPVIRYGQILNYDDMMLVVRSDHATVLCQNCQTLINKVAEGLINQAGV